MLSEERPFPGLESLNFDLVERDPFDRVPFDYDGVACSAVCFDSGGYRYILADSVLFHFCGIEFNRVTDVTKTDTWNKRLVDVDIVKCDTEDDHSPENEKLPFVVPITMPTLSPYFMYSSFPFLGP